MITRRALLGGGVAAVALAVAGLIYEFSADPVTRDPKYRFAYLDDEDRAIMTAIAPVMLAGALTGPQAVAQVVRGLDVAIGGLPLETRAQIRQLFGLLRFPLTRMFAAGIWHPWHAAQAGEIEHFLQSWRYSRIVKLRSAYDALHQLLMSAWYATEPAWNAIGYDGPPAVG